MSGHSMFNEENTDYYTNYLSTPSYLEHCIIMMILILRQRGQRFQGRQCGPRSVLLGNSLGVVVKVLYGLLFCHIDDHWIVLEAMEMKTSVK